MFNELQYLKSSHSGPHENTITLSTLPTGSRMNMTGYFTQIQKPMFLLMITFISSSQNFITVTLFQIGMDLVHFVHPDNL
jgi:hypothetical protein